jgi:hypothetical protein
LKKTPLIVGLLIVVPAILYYIVFGIQHYLFFTGEETTDVVEQKESVSNKLKPKPSSAISPLKSKSKATQKPVTSMNKKEGQKAMQETFREALKEESSIEELVTILKDFESLPSINREGDESFGHVYSISLKKAFPGTRNFYAQYESSPGSAPRVQRISYELPPGPESVIKAREFFDTIDGVERVVEEGEEFGRVQYKDGRHCWYKVMDEEWIAQPNPINAYSKDDIGTVVIVCEDDIHPHMDGNEDGHGHNHDHGD